MSSIGQIGFEPLARQDASLFFRLVSDPPMVGGLILIAANKGIKDGPELLRGDAVLSTAILDRLLHYSHVLNTQGTQLSPARSRAGRQSSAMTHEP